MNENADQTDITKGGLREDLEMEMLHKQRECSFIWTTKAGDPFGVIMYFLFKDGRFWLAAAASRQRVAAVKRDPRVAIIVSSHGIDMPDGKTVTYKGICRVRTDEETMDWLYPEFAAYLRPGDEQAQQALIAMFRGPNRVVLEVEPTYKLGFDSDNMHARVRETSGIELGNVHG